MAFLTFLNELSYPQGSQTQASAREVVRTLIALLKELKAERSDLALHSSVPLGAVPLGDNLWLSALRADADTIDEWRFLRGLENRAPFHIGLDRKIAANVDFEFEDKSAIALGLAYEFDALAVSFDCETWRRSEVDVFRLELQDEALESEVVVVRNASIRGHVDPVRAWMRIVALQAPSDGDDLWDNRAERFPRLRFLPRVEEQVRSLRSGAPELLAVNRRLWEIQCALAEWNPESHALPTFRTKVTPEHEQRRSLFNFVDVQGEVRCFDLHARYTPGAGRIHLWCDRS
ncbi:hypothetical protein IVB12_09085 [Bradyrhizobium sp. 179]|nr:hypothetical protein [Bradyrhizobium sp. 179]MCK1542123.1 hypothetical protein [Bradyrhizobium sp. 179]